MMTFRSQILCKIKLSKKRVQLSRGHLSDNHGQNIWNKWWSTPFPFTMLVLQLSVAIKNMKTNIVRRGMGRNCFIPIPIYFVHDCLNKKLIKEDGKWKRNCYLYICIISLRVNQVPVHFLSILHAIFWRFTVNG